MAVLNLRTAAAVAVGVGIGAALVHRHHAAESCCEKPATGARCC